VAVVHSVVRNQLGTQGDFADSGYLEEKIFKVKCRRHK